MSDIVERLKADIERLKNRETPQDITRTRRFRLPFHAVRNEAGGAIAIADADGWYLLHLDAGTVRNEAEGVVDYVVGRLNAAAEIESLRAAVNLLAKCYKFVEDDAIMMADLTRFAPLDPESQAIHDSTEALSEALIREIQSNAIATAAIERLEEKA